ncbi:hypothetical protein [uncultured Thiocystis sp.]|uniref:hypothetical protein n=1 Tax=uncultured Thiocystis sp. TaxID=1202134 RepID=UPI0025DDA410|nr:hypothetical protein [uncultured Thiocystis sp.]
MLKINGTGCQIGIDERFTPKRQEAGHRVSSSNGKTGSGTMKTMIELTEPQAKSLSVLAEQRDRSLSELVGLAVNEYLRRYPSVPEGDAAFGLWRQRREDGLSYQERLRSEWER